MAWVKRWLSEISLLFFLLLHLFAILLAVPTVDSLWFGALLMLFGYFFVLLECVKGSFWPFGRTTSLFILSQPAIFGLFLYCFGVVLLSREPYLIGGFLLGGGFLVRLFAVKVGFFEVLFMVPKQQNYPFKFWRRILLWLRQLFLWGHFFSVRILLMLACYVLLLYLLLLKSEAMMIRLAMAIPFVLLFGLMLFWDLREYRRLRDLSLKY